MLSSSINKILDMDKEIRGASIRLEDLQKGKTAIVVVDMVNGFVHQGLLSSPRILAIVDPIKRLMARAQGCEKIFFLDRHSDSSPELKTYGIHAVIGSGEDELIPELAGMAEGAAATVIQKNSTNGFHAPGFRAWLEKNEGRIENYIVTGCEADICVAHFAATMKTYFNEKNLNRRIIVPIDCVETYDYGTHDGDLMKVISLWEMKLNGIEVVDEIT